MQKIKSLILGTTISLIMVGCANVPKEEDLQQLNKTQLSELLPGHTITSKADYGRWAAYYKDGATGVGLASGNWGKEGSAFNYTIDQDGEICTTFMGEWDWAKPEHKYCGLLYTDQSGMYYSRTTENTSKPKRIGQRKKIEITEGDQYELTEN